MRPEYLDATMFVVASCDVQSECMRRELADRGLRASALHDLDRFLIEVLPGTCGCIVTKLHEDESVSLVKKVRAKGLPIPIVAIVESISVRCAIDLMKAGASDLLEEPVEIDALVSALQSALTGAEDKRISASARYKAQQRIGRLSAREAEVMALLVEGRSSKEIAASLALSPGTVEEYRARMMSKVGAGSLAEMVRIALQAR